VNVKDIVILGGPNWAGKTTAARVLLPQFFDLHPFLNADEIAREIAPSDVESAAFAAGRQLIERMRAYVRDGKSFTIETTCSGRSYIPLPRTCKETGWRIALHYFWLPSPEHSIARVAKRVSHGGHHIPDEVIYRRFRTGLWNMRHSYLPLAETASIYDNSGEQRVLIADREAGMPLLIHDRVLWSRIEELTPWEGLRDKSSTRLTRPWPRSRDGSLPANSMGLGGTTPMRNWRRVRRRAGCGRR
jgi:predicted ABC-type ATPase